MMVTTVLWPLVPGVADAGWFSPTDKITAIGSCVLGKVKNRMEEYGCKKRRLLYEAHFSAALVVPVTPPETNTTLKMPPSHFLNLK
jgi:hypothetical protein